METSIIVTEKNIKHFLKKKYIYILKQLKNSLNDHLFNEVYMFLNVAEYMINGTRY